MLGIVAKVVPTPPSSTGLHLADNALRVLGVDAAAAQAYLDQIRASWPDIVRADARAKIEQQGRALIREYMLQLKQAQAQAVKDELTAAVAAIDAAQSVAEINALRLPAWAQIGYMQREDGTWEPYPESCPWTVAT